MFEPIKMLLSALLSPSDNADLQRKFSHIYFNNLFQGGESRSGAGSSMEQTTVIRRELPNLVQEFGIKIFMDAPCGDWHWMRETRLGAEQYIGVDIVGALIENNRRQFGNSSTSFVCLNLVSDDLPRADLIFCRDCLVHLNFEDIRKVIANFKRSGAKYLLTTTFTARERNVDLVGRNIWRPLNLELPPFNFPKPLESIDEQCTECKGDFADKHLGLWALDKIA